VPAALGCWASTFAEGMPSLNSGVINFEEAPMGELTDKVEGKTKETVGAATGNRRLEAEGKGKFFRGQMKQRWEDLKRGVREVWKGQPRRSTT
jgi:uncharacterized protein YjbJ (UPF0337 family)